PAAIVMAITVAPPVTLLREGRRCADSRKRGNRHGGKGQGAQGTGVAELASHASEDGHCCHSFQFEPKLVELNMKRRSSVFLARERVLCARHGITSSGA